MASLLESRVEQARAAAPARKRKRRADHPTVQIEGIEIDEDLAPLIRRLWEAGIRTSMCCQEHSPGTCWIQFPAPDEAIKFFVPASTIVGSCRWTLDDSTRSATTSRRTLSAASRWSSLAGISLADAALGALEKERE